ncbi:hypothetical protein HDV01_004538 [Terramyces sp. JEL0728]|nr:hypothetical protein HDV01_004538 [Terramyces sp. JEL0728]
MNPVFAPPTLLSKKSTGNITDTIPTPTAIPDTLQRVNSSLRNSYQGFDYMLAQFVEQTQVANEITPSYPLESFTETLTITDPSKENTFIPPRLLTKKSFRDEPLQSQLDVTPTITVTFAPPKLLPFTRQPSSLRNTIDHTEPDNLDIQVSLFEKEIQKKSPNVTDLNLFEKEISLNRMKSLSKSPLDLFESLPFRKSVKSPGSIKRSASVGSRRSFEYESEAKLFYVAPLDITEVKAYWQISEEYHGI